MLNTEWNRLNRQQMGRYGEIYARMTFLSYGIDVYPSEVDDHGVDFLIKDKHGFYQEIQVKSVSKTKYAFVKKRMMQDQNGQILKNYFLCLINFIHSEEPKVYLIPATEWYAADGVLLVDRDYLNKKSEPEYGININKKSQPLLDKYEVSAALIAQYFE